MFQIEHISKSYGKKQVLNDVSFPVPEGCAIGILGVNGSGKSTLLSCIAKKYAGTLIGDYICFFMEKNRNTVEDKALYYGLQALLETRHSS